MRILQNVGLYPSYLNRLETLIDGAVGHQNALEVFLADGFESTHLLQGVIDGDPDFALALGNSELVQRRWATENGLPRRTALEDILLAQIEHHRTEVFYNLDPVRFDDRILGRLPGCVRRTIAWSAAPSPHTRFQGYDLVVNNFPGILARYAKLGCRTAYFFPALAPKMCEVACRTERPIDIIFVGGYSRHHLRRSNVLDAVSAMSPAKRVCYYLDLGRLNRLSELPLLGRLKLLSPHRRTPSIRSISAPALFGTELIEAFGRSKIVLNAAVDMAGDERGNIRCFEAMGCGALLLSDAGSYPTGMESGRTLVTYNDPTDVVKQATRMLDDDSLRTHIAAAGHMMLADRYSKSRQMDAFRALVD
ncbi:glycosyltransferase [Rhodoferax sp. U11-2br]|uniref:glycosyltransferase family protein n=1 Tax=Rhodoferax sp. U11-2br TaxID=2838878 RepID=UPI001BE95E72|nr:glycosyltransferase [Rhodoferax sp. U11-2br]MBT3068363.1 glycosyltransferase [Rhodoferax sp. U11-2br]